MVFAMLAAIIVVDQAIKWWAWRHAPHALINAGGDFLIGTRVGDWYAAPVSGALLDLLDFGVLSIAVAVFVRRRRPVMVLIPGAMMIGGWSSNLLDRLGMHYWTAPGSVRGAVDFIPFDQGYYYNVADIFIVVGTILFVSAVCARCWGKWATRRPAATEPVTPTTQRRPVVLARLSAVAGAVGLIVVVGIGAMNYGGVTAPMESVSVTAQ
jgi:lipoprotein signal peptidase